jgi:hypothetical protein
MRDVPAPNSTGAGRRRAVVGLGVAAALAIGVPIAWASHAYDVSGSSFTAPVTAVASVPAGTSQTFRLVAHQVTGTPGTIMANGTMSAITVAFSG